jgi:hypothetical protein
MLTPSFTSGSESGWRKHAGPEQRRIAQEAYGSLTSVGNFMRDFMRQVAGEIEALPAPKNGPLSIDDEDSIPHRVWNE